MADIDYSEYFDETGLKSPYYRVSVKAIVRDDQDRVLVCADDTGTYELPGGGWEHGETFEEALSREFEEEMGVAVQKVGNLLFAYYGRGTYQGEVRKCLMLRIVAEAELESFDFTYDEDEVTEVRFVTREEFLTLNWCDVDPDIVKYVDKIWPPKNSAAAGSTLDHDAIAP
jgi:8-oxo-dGTP diphosphatase